MNMVATKHCLSLFQKFGVMCQLPEPSPEYVVSIQEYLSKQQWKMRDLKHALGWLLLDEDYQNNVARFNKYPAITDFVRAKKAVDEKIINYCVEFRTTPQQAYTELTDNTIRQLTQQLAIPDDLQY